MALVIDLTLVNNVFLLRVREKYRYEVQKITSHYNYEGSWERKTPSPSGKIYFVWSLVHIFQGNPLALL